jgi:pimeloyl-[acyl-carrier protein] methyl ester esterase
MSIHVESAGAGPPLVLVHGWGLSGAVFEPLLPSLVARHRVHVVDLPGHGHSASIAPYTLDTLVDAVADGAARAGADTGRLTVLGWSFGGLIVQRWAARAGASIARLVLVSTSPRFVAGADWPAGIVRRSLEQFGDELRVDYAATLRRFVTLQMQDVASARTTLARLRALMATRPPPDKAALDAALAVLLAADLRDAAKTLAMPALVVTGGRDTLAPPAAGAWLARAMPRATLAPIEAAAHVPFLSHPAAFDAALRAFDDAHAA